MTYVNRNPGQVCQRCGKSTADRARGTKYCFTCAKIISKEQALKRKEYLENLEKRDQVMTPIKGKQSTSDKTGEERTYYMCPCCGLVLNRYDIFCRYCGQRMRKEEQNV